MPLLPLSPISPTLSSKMSSRKQTWQQVAAHEQSLLAAKIPESLRLHPSFLNSGFARNVTDVARICGLLTPFELEVTDAFEASVLVQKLASGQLSSLVLTTALCKRAAIAHQLINCLTEIMFDEALARAAYCDEYLAREKKVIGPLHGLPISLQDSFNIAGVRSTIGYVEFLKHQPPTSNSALVDVLIAQGAVLYVKTNVSQTLMASDTHNNVFGRTQNPINSNLTTGGSAGGEAALSALRGSVFGFGTDIAGGLRLPAMCCGVVAFKPSSNRLPAGGQTHPGRRGHFGLYPSVGPICRTIRDAEVLVKSVLQYDSWTLDETVLSTPWISPPTQNVRRFGVIFEDSKYPLHPAVARNFRTALQKLSSAGHQVMSLVTMLPDDIIATTAFTAMTVLNMDPEKTSFGFVARGGEPLVPSITSSSFPELAKMKPNINGVFNLNNDISRIRQMFREIIVNHKLDAILLPVYQSTAVEHDQIQVPAYTILANLLDYPSCVIPFGVANKALDAPFVRNLDYKPAYNPDAIEGAPCSIQIIGRNLKDEDLLASARVVEDILRS